MRILLVCAALCAASSTNVLASTEFQPIATKFAYGGRHIEQVARELGFNIHISKR